MIIFLFQLHKKGYFNRANSLKASSCRSAVVMLNKRIPKNWSTRCDDNNMVIDIDLELPSKLNSLQIRQASYRELANNLVFIAKNCLNESLERLYFVRVHMENEKITIDALTEGKYLSKLATLKKTEFIKEHLLNTVQVKETVK